MKKIPCVMFSSMCPVFFSVQVLLFRDRSCRSFRMVIRMLIGDNNLSKFWAAYQFSRPGLKSALQVTATDFDTLDHALSQSEEKDSVIVSVLTSLLLEEVNQLEVSSSAFNVCEQVVTRLMGICPRSPGCQVRVIYLFILSDLDYKLFLKPYDQVFQPHLPTCCFLFFTVLRSPS